MLSISPLPCFEDNYIWVLRRDRSVIAIDPGQAAPLLDYLQRNALTLSALLLTHRHADHVGGVAEIVQQHPVPVYGAGSIEGVTQPLHDGERLRLLDTDWQVIATPGHTHEHLCYYSDGALFCGDTLFGAGCGRLFDGTAAEMQASLQRLAALPAQTRVYCAHEYTLPNLRFAAAVEGDTPAIAARVARCQAQRSAGQATVPSTLEEELATNPFLRCQVPAVIAAVRRQAPGTSSEAQVFAALREWKNHFK